MDEYLKMGLTAAAAAGALVWWFLLGVVLPHWAWFRRKFIYDEMADIRDMNAKFNFLCFDKPGHVTRRLLRQRLTCMQEELNEFGDAVENQDLDGQADALIDLVIFAKGTAAALGLPWEELWEDVHRANMSKQRGVTKRGHAVDLIKPAGWEPPLTTAILYMNGYVPGDYAAGPGRRGVDESKCRDYLANATSSEA